MIVAGALVTSAIIQGKRQTDEADRENFYLCDKHGLIRKQDMLVVAEFEDGGEVPPKCPVCFTESFTIAKERALSGKY